MKIAPLLKISPGVTAIMGGGGKTTLLYELGAELSQSGKVILTTTTHIFTPSHCPVLTGATAEQVENALIHTPLICVGEPFAKGKLSPSLLPIGMLKTFADYVLVEADGSKGLPLKAHAPYEPVLPDCTNATILVIGADGLNRPIRDVCHRSELYARLAEALDTDPVTPRLAARVICKEGYGDIIFINKAETDSQMHAALALAPLLPCPVVVGSLHRKEYICLY